MNVFFPLLRLFLFLPRPILSLPTDPRHDKNIEEEQEKTYGNGNYERSGVVLVLIVGVLLEDVGVDILGGSHHIHCRT